MTDRAALSVDLEFLEHTPAYRSASGETDRTDVGMAGVEFLLEVFEEVDAQCTFFVVGEVAERHPALIRQIAEEGHEVASHSSSHRRLSSLPKSDRREEYLASRDRIERAGKSIEVIGFRAPMFDTGPDHIHLLEEAGYEYDSSHLPVRSIPGLYDRTGGIDGVEGPTPIGSDTSRRLIEIPVSVMPYLRLPISGGWPRLLGRTYAALGFRLLRRQGRVPILYVHPWELVDLPHVRGLPSRVYRHTGSWMRETIRRILAEPVEFVRIDDLATEVADSRPLETPDR